MKDNISKGKHGEMLAESFLTQHNCVIIARRFRSRHGEIDLIAARGVAELHFVEVKYRTSNQYGAPFDAVDYRKTARLKRMAEYFLLKNGSLFLSHQIHFSVVSILAEDPTSPKIEWLQIDPFLF